MRAVQLKAVTMYKRVLAFLVANVAILGQVTQLAAIATLTAIVGTLSDDASTQGSTTATSGGSTFQIETLRAALIKTMRTIVAIANDSRPSVPDMPVLSVPALNVSSAKLVADANAMVQTVTPYQQTFISAGLASTFVADLTAATAQLDGVLTAVGTNRGQRVKATAGIVAGLQKARGQLHIISPAVEQQLAGNEPMLVEWKNISRLSPQSTSSTSTTTDTPTTTTTTTTGASPATPAKAGPSTAPSSSAVEAHHTDAVKEAA